MRSEWGIPAQYESRAGHDQGMCHAANEATAVARERSLFYATGVMFYISGVLG